MLTSLLPPYLHFFYFTFPLFSSAPFLEIIFLKIIYIYMVSQAKSQLTATDILPIRECIFKSTETHSPGKLLLGPGMDGDAAVAYSSG